MANSVVVSFSGGRTSAYMAYKMQFSPEFSEWEKHYVFANTGKEKEETLRFVERCDQEFKLNVAWIESVINPNKGAGVSFKVVDYSTAARGGEPFSAMVDKFGIPNKDTPHCTRELKTRPIDKWVSSLNLAAPVIAIGFRADEKVRANADPKRIYPLINTWPTNESMVRAFWRTMPFDLELKDYEGNCDLCWKKSLLKRLTILRENPGVETQWQEWERQGEYIFDRDGFTLDQLVEMSRRRFRRAIDKEEIKQRIPELFDIDVSRETKCHC